MKFSARLAEESLQDIDEARGYLEECREGLGDSFVFDLEARINQIVNNPYLAQKRYEDFRMAVTRRFGYKIFYTVDDNIIQIAAVWHSKRHPTSWLEGL